MKREEVQKLIEETESLLRVLKLANDPSGEIARKVLPKVLSGFRETLKEIKSE